MSQSKWSSALAAVAVLAMPGIFEFALAGQKSSTTSEPRKPLKASVAAEQPAAPVVVITGKLDLGKLSIADYGDVETTNR